MLSTLGVILISIGIMAADSEWLIIPIGLIAAGAILYQKGEGRDQQ